MVLIIVSISIISIAWIINRLHKKVKTYRKLTNIRTKELHDIAQLLAKSKQELADTNRLKNKVVTMVLHDLRSPIRFLTTITNHLTENLKKIEPAELEKKLNHLKNCTAALNNFAEQFFDWAAIQHEDFTLRIEKIRLNCAILNITSLYTSIANANNNVLVVATTDAVCYSDLQILSLIIRNIIDNANKNTENGEIKISVTEKDTCIEISIEDNGKGMTNQEIENFISDNKPGGKRASIGSTLIAGLLVKINGQLQIKQRQPSGSNFIISIPHLLLYEIDGKA
jgi:K+-sensing histidine kinase KdpD